MFFQLVYQSFSRQRRSKLLAGLAVMLGMALVTAMLAVATAVGDKINRELRAFGANLVIVPQEDTLNVEIAGRNLKPASEGAFLDEAALPAIKGIFWRNNILGFSPFFSGRVRAADRRGTSQEVELSGTYFSKSLRYGSESFTTGVRATHPWWKVQGEWPADGSRQLLAGEKLAARRGWRSGDVLELDGHPATIVGILSAAGDEDHALLAPLSLVQAIERRPGAVRRVYVSALTKPEDDFARRDPRTMSPAMRDRWYCSPYAASIAFQLQEALPGARAQPIRQVAQSEGVVLSRITGLLWLISLAALAASALAVSATMATAVLERRKEVGLMKSLGAREAVVAAIFFSEAAILALAGGIAGFLLGTALARSLAQRVFGSPAQVSPIVFPVVLALALLLMLGSSLVPIRRAIRFDPGVVLRGDA